MSGRALRKTTEDEAKQPTPPPEKWATILGIPEKERREKERKRREAEKLRKEKKQEAPKAIPEVKTPKTKTEKSVKAKKDVKDVQDPFKAPKTIAKFENKKKEAIRKHRMSIEDQKLAEELEDDKPMSPIRLSMEHMKTAEVRLVPLENKETSSSSDDEDKSSDDLRLIDQLRILEGKTPKGTKPKKVEKIDSTDSESEEQDNDSSDDFVASPKRLRSSRAKAHEKKPAKKQVKVTKRKTKGDVTEEEPQKVVEKKATQKRRKKTEKE